jgi:hypothetical protein
MAKSTVPVGLASDFNSVHADRVADALHCWQLLRIICGKLNFDGEIRLRVTDTVVEKIVSLRFKLMEAASIKSQGKRFQ